jgi:uncharacterized membrane protein YfbV (UPF0208 family)
MGMAVPMAHHLLRLSMPLMGLWMEGTTEAQLSTPQPPATLGTAQDMPLPPPTPLATVVLLRMPLPHTLEQGMELQARMPLSMPLMGLWMEGTTEAQVTTPQPPATLGTAQDMPLPPPTPLATVVLLRMPLPHTLEQGMELQARMLQLLAMLPQCQLPTVPATVLRLLPQLLPRHMLLAVLQHMVLPA